jgi:hypothetical protein
VSDINTAVVDSLKVLDLKRPIREADIVRDGREMARSRMTHSGSGVYIVAAETILIFAEGGEQSWSTATV